MEKSDTELCNMWIWAVGQTGVADLTWVETGVDRKNATGSVYESNAECSLASFDKRLP
jgi:hypothetical protein